ncbi:MAG: methyltransferase domain-containing protein [Catenulispora sp.]|nr:methyltransferase domain-containing protein [Catenulispora sp.]
MSTLLEVLDAGDAHPQAAALRLRSYDLLGSYAGRPVVDVGCGAGRAVAELTERGAHALGVDPDPAMLAAARQRWPTSAFLSGDAYNLPLDSGSMTGYRADKVLHLLDDPPRALTEARRVLTPGGRAVFLSSDWDTIVVDSNDPDTTRRLIHTKADSFPSPRAARRHYTLLLDAGFTDITTEVHTLLFTDDLALALLHRITDDQAWLSEQAERQRAGRIFVALPMFLTAGRAPV